MIRKSLTAPNVQRMEQILKEDDTESDISDLSDLSDLTSLVSVSSNKSCTCQCKDHNKQRGLKLKKRKKKINMIRSSFPERNSNFHVKTGTSTSVNLSLRDKIRLITLEDHINRHDWSVHGNKECHVCRNILENESEDDDEMAARDRYSSSVSPSSSSLYTSRSSSSLSSHPSCQKCDRESLIEEDKLADIEYLIDVPHSKTKTKTEKMTKAGCEHRLQRKHGGCRVCYECCLCKEVFLKKSSSSSESEAGGSDRGGGQLKIRLAPDRHPGCIIE